MELVRPEGCTSNYRGAHVYTLLNLYSNKKEKVLVQDWREGFSKKGRLLGDQLPVFKVTNPKNKQEWHLERPYYLVYEGKYQLDLSGKKVVHIDYAQVNLETDRVTCAGKPCFLEPVYQKPLHLSREEKFTPKLLAVEEDYKRLEEEHERWAKEQDKTKKEDTAEEEDADNIASAYGATPKENILADRFPISPCDVDGVAASFSSMEVHPSKEKQE